MAVYKVTDPNTGKVYKVTGPAGASEEQVLSQIGGYRNRKQGRTAPNEMLTPAAQYDEGDWVPPPPTPPSTWQDKLGAVQSGLLLGGHDEATAFLGALPRLLPGGESFGDAYKRIRDPMRAQQSAYREAHPVESLAYEMTGGLGTPAGLTARAVPAISGALRGGGALKEYSKGLAKALPSAAAEGATYGYLAGEGETVGEQFTDAVRGATLGATGKAVLDPVGKVLKGAVNSLSKRRLETSLGKGDDFIPANVAEPESGLGVFTRNITANLPWSPVRKQSEKAFERLNPPLLKALKGEENLLDFANKQQAGRAAATSAKGATAYSKALRNVDDTLAAKKREINVEAAQEGVRASQFKTVSTADMDKLFREEQLLSSARPGSGLTPQGKTAQAFNAETTKDWSNDGFGLVKGKTFTIDPAKVAKKASKGGIGLDDFSDGIDDILQKHLVSKTKADGTIAGKHILNARSQLAMIANQTVDKHVSAGMKYANRRAADYLDEQIGKQMSKAERKSYKDELHAWGQHQTSLGSTNKAILNEGEFTQDDWLLTRREFDPRGTGKGQSKGQQAANVNIRAKKRLDAATQDIKDTTADVKALSLHAAEESATAQKRALTDQQRKGKVKRATISRPKIPVSQKTFDLDAQVEKLKKSMSPTPNIFAMRGAQSILGNVLGLATGGLPGLGMAAVSGQMLGSQVGQRTLAGQTGVQEYIADLLRKLGSDTPAMLPQSVGRKVIQQAGSPIRRATQRLQQDEEE